MPRSVRRMKVKHRVRIPRIDIFQHTGHFGRLHLHAVTIEVKIHPVRSDSYGLWSILSRPVSTLWAKLFVSVNIVNWLDNKDSFVQNRRIFLAIFSKQLQSRFLSFYFARVNIRLNIDNELARICRLSRILDHWPGRDDHRNFLALKASSAITDINRSSSCFQVSKKLDDVGIS